MSEPIDHYSEDRREFFRKAFLALGFNGISGDYAEFGCFSGTTFGLAYQEYHRARSRLEYLPYSAAIHRRFWAFDSFAGLPGPDGPYDHHPAWTPGSLAIDRGAFEAICEKNGIPRADFEIVPGFYEETLREGTAESRHLSDIALAYVDCDLYSSICTVLCFLLPRLKHGMILALDDYFVFSATQASGARRAFVEILERHPAWRLLPYVQFAWGGLSFVVESRTVLPDPVTLPGETSA